MQQYDKNKKFTLDLKVDDDQEPVKLSYKEEQAELDQLKADPN